VTRALGQAKPDLALKRRLEGRLRRHDRPPRDTATKLYEERDVLDEDFDAERHGGHSGVSDQGCQWLRDNLVLRLSTPPGGYRMQIALPVPLRRIPTAAPLKRTESSRCHSAAQRVTGSAFPVGDGRESLHDV